LFSYFASTETVATSFADILLISADVYVFNGKQIQKSNHEPKMIKGRIEGIEKLF